MQESELDILFEEAFQRASEMTDALPQDVMLRIYAYYKHHQSINLRDAFKMNAWMQVRHLTPDEAKRLYIDTINSLIK
jgi:acyl-CoA-binding protein